MTEDTNSYPMGDPYVTISVYNSSVVTTDNYSYRGNVSDTDLCWTSRWCASDTNDCVSCGSASGSGGLVYGALCESGPDTIAVLEATVTSRSVIDSCDS